MPCYSVCLRVEQLNGWIKTSLSLVDWRHHFRGNDVIYRGYACGIRTCRWFLLRKNSKKTACTVVPRNLSLFPVHSLPFTAGRNYCSVHSTPKTGTARSVRVLDGNCGAGVASSKPRALNIAAAELLVLREVPGSSLGPETGWLS
jgi:hypothetical protein